MVTFIFITSFLFVSSLIFLLMLRFLFIFANIRFKPLIKLCCKIGWHWSTKITEHDGVSQHAICDGCGKHGKYDSNGNFF